MFQKSISETNDIVLKDSQQEENYLNQILARSFLEGVENPFYEQLQLDKIKFEKDISQIDKTNYKEKWRIYSQTLKERQATIKDYKSTIEKFERVSKAQQIIRTDLVKGNRVLKKLYNFNKLKGEENMDFHLFINQNIRRLNENQIFSQMKQTITQVQKWQNMNTDLEEFLLNCKAYIYNLGELLLIQENSRQGFKESIHVRKQIEDELKNTDYYKQKIERQSNLIGKLSQTMEYVVKNYTNNEFLEKEYIDLRGDVLSLQKSIRTMLVGEQPQQIDELNHLISLCRKLNRIQQQQQYQIENTKKSLNQNDNAQKFFSLESQLKAAQLKQTMNKQTNIYYQILKQLYISLIICIFYDLLARQLYFSQYQQSFQQLLRVQALEEQIKTNSKNFSSEITKLQVQIQEKKNTLHTVSISNIQYKLPSDVYYEQSSY